MFPVELPHAIHQFSSDVDLADEMGCITSPLRLLALFFFIIIILVDLRRGWGGGGEVILGISDWSLELLKTEGLKKKKKK